MQKTVKYFFRILRIIHSGSLKWTLTNYAVSLIKGFIPLIVIWLLKLLVDEVISIVKSPDVELSFSLILYIVLTAFAYLVGITTNLLAKITSSKLVRQVSEKMYALLHKATSSIPFSILEKGHYFDMIYRASREVGHRPATIVNSMIQVLQFGLSLFAMVFVLLNYHWSVIFVVLLAIAPLLLVKLVQAKKTFQWRNEKTSEEREMNYYHRILTEPVFAKELRIFGFASVFEKRFSRLNRAYSKKEDKRIVRYVLWETIASVFSLIVLFAFMLFIVADAIGGEISLGLMLMIIMALNRGMAFAQNLARSISDLYENSLFISNFFRVIDQKYNTAQVNDSISLNDSIRMKDVSFSYDEKRVLNKVNLQIPKGKTIAVVGENGAGKSTLVKLLCKLYVPADGEIYFDSVQLSAIDSSVVQASVSAIMQDFLLYNLSVQENVGISNLNSMDRTRIKEILRSTGLEKTISELPDGIDSLLGNLFENSSELSIGEWQKMALARALYKEAEFYIFDEPTSALDGLAETQIIDMFFKATEGKTKLIISHKLTTVLRADYIYVMKQGEIVEQGTHQSLVEMNGEYYKLFTSRTRLLNF